MGDVLGEIEKQLTELKKAKAAFDEYSASRPHIVAQRREWVREYNQDLQNNLQRNGSGHADWCSREPGLSEMPEVVAAHAAVAVSEAALRDAQANLAEVEAKGTPLSAFVRTVSMAESVATGLSRAIVAERRKAILLEKFGTNDEWRVSNAASALLDQHSSVVMAAEFRFNPTLAGRDEAIGTGELSSAYARVIDALGRLKALAAAETTNTKD
jgi:hypothetical protein